MKRGKGRIRFEGRKERGPLGQENQQKYVAVESMGLGANLYKVQKGPRVMACICLAKGVTLLEGVALLESVWPCCSRCVTVGVDFKTLILSSWKLVFC